MVNKYLLYTLNTDSLDGKGQSSNNKVITEGPRGSCIGMTWIMELTTWIQPSSLSAMLCKRSIELGGSCSLKKKKKGYSIV